MGAFAGERNKIYLSRELVRAGDEGAIASVILEEYGHCIDSQINSSDAPGDEGEIFGAIAQGKVLSQAEILALKGEDDGAIAFLDGEEVSIEQKVESDLLAFFAKDFRISETGFNGKIDGLVTPKLDIPLNVGLPPGLPVSTVAIQGNVGASVGIVPYANVNDWGRANFDYPIKIDIERSKETLGLEENFSLETTPTVGEVSFNGSGFNFANAGVDLKYDIGPITFDKFAIGSIPGINSLYEQNIPPVTFNGFQGEKNLISLPGSGEIEFFDGLVAKIEFPKIEEFDLEILKSAEFLLPSIEAKGTGSFLTLTGDLDLFALRLFPAYESLVTSLNGRLGNTVLADAEIKGLGFSLQVPNQKGARNFLSISADVIDVTANVGLGIEQIFKLKEPKVDVTVSVDNGTVDGGKTITKSLGEPFSLTTPSSGSGVMRVDAKYTLSGLVENQIDLISQSSPFKIDVLKGELSYSLLKGKTGIDKLATASGQLLEGEFKFGPYYTQKWAEGQRKLKTLSEIPSFSIDKIGGIEDQDKNLIVEKTYYIPYNMPVTISDVTVDEGKNPPPGEGKAYFTFNGKYYEWQPRTVELFTGPAGDILSRITLETLGSASPDAYNFIAFHNNISDPNLIIAGSTIEVPKEVSKPDTNGYAVFEVKQSGNPSASVKINYSTADESATAGNDYKATSGKLSIPAGQGGVILVPIVGDTNKEETETFKVTLTKQDGTPFAEGVPTIDATGTIIDDDKKPDPKGPGGDSHNDPRLVSFDKQYYDFQAAGEFILAQSTTGELKIQVRQQPVNNDPLTNVSINTAVATVLGGKRIGIYKDNQTPLSVDGQPTEIADNTYITIGDGRIYREGNTYTVVYATGDQLVAKVLPQNRVDIKVFLSPDREGKVAGLLGNNNNDPKDDLAKRDGTILTPPVSIPQLYGEYADSWRITQAESLFDYQPGQNTNTFTLPNYPRKKVTLGDLNQADVQKAYQLIGDRLNLINANLLEGAIIDFILTGFDESIIQGAIEAEQPENSLSIVIPLGAVDDFASTTVNTPVAIATLLNDSATIGVQRSISAFDQTSTAGGSISIDNNGTPDDLSDDLLTYTPPANFTGTDSFNYTFTDGTQTDTAKVTVTVPGLNLSNLKGSNGFVIKDVEAGSFSGVCVSKIGDFNGDRIDDLIVGAFGADPNGNNAAGKSFVIFGTNQGFPANLDPSTLNGSNGFVLNGINAESFSGGSVSSAGDINNDGFDDLIVGACGAAVDGKNNAGQTYVVFGSNAAFPALNLSDLNGSNGFVLNGTNEFDYLGLAVSSAGDINDDGFDDILVGVPGAAGGGSGKTYAVFGRSQGFPASLNLSEINGENSFAINNAAANAGISVSKAGDINGDGITDLIVGTEADSNGNNTAGESYVLFGSSNEFPANLNLSELNGSNGFVLNGIDKNSGTTVSGAGDINSDGIDDVIIVENNASKSYVVFGSDKGFSASVDLSKLNGSNGILVFNGIDGNLISSVSKAGDVNGDRIDDLIIGVSSAAVNDKFAAGKSYVMFGSNSGFSANMNLSKLNGNNGFVLNGVDADDLSGTSVSEAGDINSDGTDDLIIGTPGSLFKDSPGKSHVVFGSTTFGNDPTNQAKLLFNPGFYLKNNPDVAAAVELGEIRTAFEHFIKFGLAEGRVSSSIFADYESKNIDVAAAIARGEFRSGFEHFIKFGFAEGRLPGSDFSSLEVVYLAENPDVAQAVQQGVYSSGLEHLIRFGMAEGREIFPSFSALSETFDSDFYLAQNPDVAEAVNQDIYRSGFEHFVKFGLFEGRDPGNEFNNSLYLANNPDVAEAVSNGIYRSGFEHFMKFGFGEDRDGGAIDFEVFGNSNAQVNIINGSAGNDSLTGSFGNDILSGVDPNAANPGAGEVDILTSGEGSDRFVLGDAGVGVGAGGVGAGGPRPYYTGGSDYAAITDFNPTEDFIQLSGGAADYQLATSPQGLPAGTAIFRRPSQPTPPSDNQDELIAIVQDASDLSLDASYFRFV